VQRNQLWVSAPRTLLQHTATHCNTLQHTATPCNTLQHTAIHCNEESAVSACASHYCDTLQHTAMHCNVLQRGICCECLHLALLQRTTAPHCNTLQLNATRNLPWVPASRTAATHCNEESAVSVCAPRCNALQWGFCCGCLRLRHVTRMNESSLRHVTRMNESSLRHVILWMSQVAHTYEACRRCKPVVSACA